MQKDLNMRQILNFENILELTIIISLSHFLELNIINIYINEIKICRHFEYNVKYIILLMNYYHQMITHHIYNFIFMILSMKLKIDCICQIK